MKRIVIIGGGFAGLSAAQTLHRKARDLDVLLFDQRPTWDFLPMLPDLIGERTTPGLVAYPIEPLARKYSFRFVQEPVIDVNLTGRTVTTTTGGVECDYLIIAAGAQTNFHGLTEMEKNAYKIDSARDAMRVHDLLSEGRHDTFIVVGGGYTGIEAATELWAYCRRHNQRKKIIVCEAGPQILGMLGDDCRNFVQRTLDGMEIDVRTKTSVQKIDGDAVTLSTGDCLQRAAVIWAAGMHTPPMVRSIEVPKSRDGRLQVSPSLQVAPQCYAAGDSAQFIHNDKPLRQSVQFAVKEGQRAAKNILREIAGETPEPFRPYDPGFVVPLANNRGCGVVMGMHLSGILPSALHYSLCVFRSRGLMRRLRLISSFRRLL